MDDREPIGFQVSISGRDDGTVEAVYFRFRHGKVAKTREIEEDVVIADYDENGDLIGLEILAPVKISDLEALVEKDTRPAFRRFAKQTRTDLVEC